MTRIFSTARAAMMAFACILLVACSQSAISTYGGSIGNNKLTTAEMRQAKILSARKRAKAKSLAARKAFKARKAKRREAVKQRRIARLERKTKKVSSRKITRKAKRSAKRNTTRRNIKRNAKVAKAASSSKVRRIKKTQKAYVPAISRKAGKLQVNKPWKCVPSRLKRVIADVRKRYGSVTINSTHRSRGKNRKVGGKRNSYHLHCKAVDFRVHGKTRGLTRYLARHPLVGGYKRYPSGYYHIDTGPKRTW